MEKKKSSLLPQSKNLIILILIALTILSLGLLIAFIGLTLSGK